MEETTRRKNRRVGKVLIGDTLLHQLEAMFDEKLGGVLVCLVDESFSVCVHWCCLLL